MVGWYVLNAMFLMVGGIAIVFGAHDIADGGKRSGWWLIAMGCAFALPVLARAWFFVVLS